MLSIVIPTYNEKDNIRPLIAQIGAALDGICDYEILFVDDSIDETPILLEAIAREDQRVRYIHRDDKAGLASAVVCGFDHARGDVIAVMDADLQHPPRLLRSMAALIDEGADVVLPSRYIGGGGSEGLSFIRVLASKGARLAGKIFLKSMRKISDPMSGFFMIKKSVIEGVTLRPIGWKILMEVLVLGHYSSVIEIPYAFEKRNAGESKLSLKVTIEYFLHIFSLVARSEKDRRFFMFALVGLSGVLVDMLAFYLLNSIGGVASNAAATLSAAIPIATNYLLNRNLTWAKGKQGNAGGEFLRYVLVCALGLGIKNLVVFLIGMTGLSPFLCNLCGIALATLSNYFLSSKWVFKRKTEKITYTVMNNI